MLEKHNYSVIINGFLPQVAVNKGFNLARIMLF